MDDSGPSSADSQDIETWSACRDGDLDARRMLFERYQAFAFGIAKKHHLEWTGSDLELSDLQQAAAAALLDAIDHFDPSNGAPFTAYARLRIRGSVLDASAKASEVREQLAVRAKMRRERIASLYDMGAAITRDPLQSLMDLAVGLALGFMLEGSSLYVDDDKPDPKPSAYDSVAWQEMIRRLKAVLKELPDRDRTILHQHYVQELSFEDIGAGLGLTRSRISQLHKSALTTLRTHFSKVAHFKLET